MRALSVRQPWALAICHGKDVENRSRATWHRGLIAVHASKAFDVTDPDILLDVAEMIGLTPEQAEQQDHRGAVIAVAEIVGCHLHTDPVARCDFGDAPICSWWAARGQWHWQLANVRTLAAPVPCKGALGLWRLPDDVDAQVRVQLDLEASDA